MECSAREPTAYHSICCLAQRSEARTKQRGRGGRGDTKQRAVLPCCRVTVAPKKRPGCWVRGETGITGCRQADADIRSGRDPQSGRKRLAVHSVDIRCGRGTAVDRLAVSGSPCSSSLHPSPSILMPGTRTLCRTARLTARVARGQITARTRQTELVHTRHAIPISRTHQQITARTSQNDNRQNVSGDDEAMKHERVSRSCIRCPPSEQAMPARVNEWYSSQVVHSTNRAPHAQ